MYNLMVFCLVVNAVIIGISYGVCRLQSSKYQRDFDYAA